MAQTQTRKKKILGDVKRARRRRALASVVAVALIIGIIVGVVVFLPRSSVDTSMIDRPISQTTYNQLTAVSDSTLNTVGSGQGAAKGLTSTSGSLLTSGGKPEVIYMGGDYCPYCGAERWSIIVALSKFGTWGDGSLVYMLSSGTDTPANVPTFSFSSATYTSNYISFVGVELYHRDGSAFQTAPPEATSAMNQYDSSKDIPFVDVANQYVYTGSQDQPSVLLSTGNWTQIGSQLNDPNTSVAKAVDGAANYLISAICRTTNGNPSGVCTQNYAGLTQAPFSPTNMPPSTSSINGMIIGDARAYENI